MGLIGKLLKEYQLSLSDEITPQSVSNLLKQYLSQAETGAHFDGLTTLDDVKEEWERSMDEVFWEVAESEDFDYDRLDIEYVHQTMQDFINSEKDLFLNYLDSVRDNEYFPLAKLFTMLAEIFDSRNIDLYDNVDDLDDDVLMDNIIEIILEEEIPYRILAGERDDLMEFYIEDFGMENYHIKTDYGEKDLLEYATFLQIKAYGGLDGNEGGIEDMFGDMQYNMETINGVDHIYCEREMKFDSFKEILDLHQELGIFWSWAEDGGEAYSGSGDNRLLLKAMAPVSSVDWGQTFYINLYSMAYEKEVRMHDGEPLLLREVDFNFTSDDVDNKVKYIMSMYFPHKKKDDWYGEKTFSYDFHKKVKNHLIKSNDTLLRGREIKMKFKDEKYYRA